MIIEYSFNMNQELITGGCVVKPETVDILTLKLLLQTRKANWAVEIFTPEISSIYILLILSIGYHRICRI